MGAETRPISEPRSSVRDDAPVPRRWTLHGLNNGLIFGATCHGVRILPRPVSYGIGDAGTWIAWRRMAETRRALADNLAAVFPGEPQAALERRALDTLRSYARDTIDFLRALGTPPAATRGMFQLDDQDRRWFLDLVAQGRGVIAVTGHYGNWEIGSLLLRRGLDLPMTIVAMAEADPEVNRLRRRIRESIGAGTIEVRQSLDTALQIRRRLADNHVVAMLIDRHYGRDRVAVTLLGRRAWFLRTPLLMAHATGAPIVPVFFERLAPACYATRLAAPIVVGADCPRDEAIGRAAQAIADALTARITQHPHFWYQFYRYWDAQRDAYEGLS